MQSDKLIFLEYQTFSQDILEKWWNIELSKNCLIERQTKYGSSTFVTVNLEILSEKSSKFICEGMGKGIFSEALLTARFEGMENFATTGQNIQNISFNASLNQMIQYKKKLYTPRLPVELNEFYLRDKILPWLAYKNFSSEDKLFLPACSISPTYLDNLNEKDDFPYSEIYHHATSIGLAAATNLNDALLHAILEIIERDALSFFLVHFFLLNNHNLTLIDIETIPEFFSTEIKKTLKKEDTLYILKLPNSFNIFTYLCLIKSSHGIHKGIGASIDNETAFKKSLLESIESYNLPVEHMKSEQKLIAHSLKEFPELLDCADINIFKHEMKKEVISFDSQKIDPQVFLPTKQLKYLIQNIGLSSQEIYYCQLYNATYFQVVHVVITQMEEFSSIIKGTFTPTRDRLNKLIATKKKRGI